jgi:uncharacterized protein (DUF2384 family)
MTMAGKRTVSPQRRRSPSVKTLLELVEELRRFLPTAVDRAQALGVSRETIASWDRRQVRERVRGENLTRLRRSVEVCRVAARYMSTAEQVGLWLKAPQTFLYGRTPLEYLADDGDAQFLMANIPPPVSRVSDAARQAHRESRSALAALVGPPPERARKPAAAEQTQRLPVRHVRQQVRPRKDQVVRRHVVPNAAGGWKVVKDTAGRASVHARTQAQATERAREIVARLGSGEVVIHGRDGRIKASQTIGGDITVAKRARR